MKLAIIGATGMVGRVLLEIVEERSSLFDTILLAAGPSSVGKEVKVRGQNLVVQSVEEVCEAGADFAIFSAGSDVSKEWAPRFAEKNTVVIDNSSAFRMEPNIPLVVPEINAESIKKDDFIIANPNCSTIQMVLALSGLHQKYKLKRLVISTYQSVSGTGKKAVQQLNNERQGIEGEMAYPYPIDKNCLPHNGAFDDLGYTQEETKLVFETQKILDDRSIGITATVVRVPVEGGHSEAVNAAFHHDFTLEEVRSILEQTPGVVVQDNPAKREYPMPLYCQGKDEVFVGRIRRDLSQANSLNLWIVADNLRKGAATNAYQIAEYLIKKGRR